MRDHSSWSLNLGRWGGVHVRLHMFFLLFAVLTFYLGWSSEQASRWAGVNWTVLQIVVILFFGVVLHEMGHLYVARRSGGTVDCIVLGPLGGLTSIKGIQEPRAELLSHLAGPAANLAVCLVCLPILLVTSDNVVGLLRPLAPAGLVDPNGFRLLVSVKLCFWINWLLVLVNLLPVFPFDGARAFRAALLVKWPRAGRPAASRFVASVAKFIAIGIFVTAFIVRSDDIASLVPMRFALILLAIFLFFSAKHEERRSEREVEADDKLPSPEFSSDLSGLEREFAKSPGHASGPLKRWLDRRRELRYQRRLETEAEEEQCVDEILARLHEQGMDSLSVDDRALLERVSARLRSRQRP